MHFLLSKWYIFLSILPCLSVVNSKLHFSEENDLIVNYLLNGDEISESDESNENNEGGQPILSNGVWTCGNCDDYQKLKLSYTENYNLDNNNISDGDIQVGLSIENMRCVTVTGDDGITLKKVSGKCEGSPLTLAVGSARQFKVDVYEN